MRADEMLTLFDHLFFARDRILDAVRSSSSGLEDVSPPTTIRSLHATLVHEVDVEWSWRERLDSPDATTFDEAAEDLTTEDLPDLDAIAERWDHEEAELRAWIARLGDAGLAAPCEAERPSRHPRWYHLIHLYSHGLQQLSDAATLLSAAGQSPGELDFLDFVESRERRETPGE